MPPPAVKTVRDLIYWQYAKIISQSAGMGKRNYGFVMNRFKKLKEGEIFWNKIREYVKEHETPGVCIYCGQTGDVTLEHLFPRSMGGPEDEKNVVWVCPKCNSSKGARRPYEWYTILGGLREAKYNLPRIAEGKYLKLAFEILRDSGLLDISLGDLTSKVCPRCDLDKLCKREDTAGRLSPLCLDGMICISLNPF